MRSRGSIVFLMIWLSLVLVVALPSAMCQATYEGLPASVVEQFKTPPDSAKPRVWWHWMSGNVTQEGITADLEWMHRVGIGGMQMFDGDLGVPHYMKPIIFMTPEWQAAMKHAAAEAARLDLEMAMAASGGWSETAGPWVKPSEAMKKVVWSETAVSGPVHFHGVLPKPPGVNGPFQGLVLNEMPMTQIEGGAPATYAPPSPPTYGKDVPFYADSVVLAYRMPKAEKPMTAFHPAITSSDPHFDTANLSDSDYSTIAELHASPEGAETWIEWEFPEPYTARSFTLGMATQKVRVAPALPNGRVAWSNDGVHWTDFVTLSGSPQWGRPFSVRTFTFAPVTARFFRLTLQQVKLTPDQIKRGITVPSTFSIAEAQLYATPRVNYFEDKASFGTFIATADTPTMPVDGDEAVALSDVIDLTGKMKFDGTLDWEAPAGNWVILRLGYSLTGKKNHPATPEATGYEVDKLSAEHVGQYMRTYTEMIRRSVSPEFYGKSFRYFLMDSWEAGQENWTESMLAEFRKRRGYDPLPYLPVLTGRIVASAAASDAFLWDYRRTIGELLAENHYGLATKMLEKQGLGLYAEAMGIYLPTTGDGLLNKGMVTVPMGEFWTPLPGDTDTPMREADVREATSAAHIYGKPIAATESFTSMPTIPGWAQSPYYLKQLADQNFARGVNRIVFHTSDHQPFVDDKHKPGITLGYYGQHYSRNITWAEQAVAWNTYLARCSYLLQLGEPVADVAYFYGEGAPVTVPFWKHFTPAVPSSALFDYVNSDVLLSGASARDSKLHLESGMNYRVLVIPDEMTSLTLPMLRKLHALVADGITLVAPRVTASPSLADSNFGSELHALANELWGETAAPSGSRTVGRGKVYWGITLDEVLRRENVAPDFLYEKPHVISEYAYPLPRPDADIVWNHRKDGDADIYFVASQKSQSEEVLTSYRVVGKAAELWHPDTGEHAPVSYSQKNGRTEVALRLGPDESVFVVFSGKGAESRQLPESSESLLAALDGPWSVRFTGSTAPQPIELPALQSWTELADTNVKYFSGTAVYTRTVQLDAASLKAGGRILLDLGRVREIAEVAVNGTPAGGILWKPPFVADITDVLKPGQNRIEVRVTNLWPNRLIGDQQPGVKEKHSFTVYGAYNANDPLIESGLMGPVRILRSKATQMEARK